MHWPLFLLFLISGIVVMTALRTPWWIAGIVASVLAAVCAYYAGGEK